jgi:hypothetical protein
MLLNDLDDENKPAQQNLPALNNPKITELAATTAQQPSSNINQ